MLPGRLIAVADADFLGADLADRTAEAARGGVSWVLVRAKGRGAALAADLARRIAERCPGLVLSMHGYSPARRETGCRGLHLPAGPLGTFHAGEPPEVVVGVSCHDGAELGRAAAEGADYAFLSPVFPPRSKALRGKLLGVEGFAAAVRAARLPVFALGGITPERVEELARAGASGVAVCGDLFLAADVASRAAEWVEAVRTAYGEAGGEKRP
jgi:thiamine-phosphate pyrophosphorylase